MRVLLLQRDERREHRSAGGSVAERVPVGLRDRLSYGQPADGALLQRGNINNNIIIISRGIVVKYYV